MGVSFLCICPPKSIQFEPSKDNSRAEISAQLAAVDAFQCQEACQLHCPGAGLAYLPSPDLSVKIEASCFAAFKGQLENYAYLVRKYCAKRLQQDEVPTLNQIKEAAPLTTAEVVCELYQTLGTTFLPKLKGDFAFVCFDSRKVRVLAARATAGGVSLWQARGPDACLCIGSGNCEPSGSHSKLDIQPGFFKYGWYADPQRFATAVPEGSTSAAAQAAQKAMQGIAMTSKPPSLQRNSTGSGVSSMSTSDFMLRSVSMTSAAPIAIGSNSNSKESSNDNSLASSMYTDTLLDGSVTSDISMMTAKTNKTRRGKRGGKKQRENSQMRRMQSLPQSVSPVMASSPSGSQADQKGWWRSSASARNTSPLLQAVRSASQPPSQAGSQAGDNSADDASQGDTMSSISLADVPMARALSSPAAASALDPAQAPGHADAAWGQDNADSTADELQFRLSSGLGLGRLPTVVEHMDEGMSRPQSLADLSKAGWTVDNALSRCSSHANISRMTRISSFPELGTMPEVSISSGSSPPSALPQYPSHRQLADLGTRMSAAFSGLSSSELPSEARQKPASVLNPHAASFEPGATPQGEVPSARQAARAVQGPGKAPLTDGLTASASLQKPEVVRGFVSPPDVNMGNGTNAQQTQQALGTASGLSSLADGLQKATSMFNREPSGLSGALSGEKADKAVARRLLLKKRTPSFSKSKSCNDLVAAEPKSPTRSPFAPLAHLAQ